MINIHRIIADDKSVVFLLKDLENYYNEMSDEPIHFDKNILTPCCNENCMNSNDSKKNGLKYYEDYFNCEYNEVTLPRKRGNYLISDDEIDSLKEISLNINGEEYNNIKNFIQSHNLNPESVFISIYGFIMYKYSGQNYVYTSLITDGRNPSSKGQFGNFSTIYPFLI